LLLSCFHLFCFLLSLSSVTIGRTNPLIKYWYSL
jgi:hypothetical protein